MNDGGSTECDIPHLRETSSVAGGHGTRCFDRLCKPAAHRTECESGNFAFRRHGKAGGLAGKFLAAVELHSGFFQEFGGKSQVFGTVHAPEPEFFFVALQEVKALFQLFHGAIEGAGKKIDGKGPCMAGIINLNTDAIFAGLIAFHAAAVVVSNDSCSLGASCHGGHQLKLLYVLFQFEPERL
jgi:hypothetical protein